MFVPKETVKEGSGSNRKEVIELIEKGKQLNFVFSFSSVCNLVII